MKFPDELGGFEAGESRIAFGLIGLLTALAVVLVLTLVLDPPGGDFSDFSAAFMSAVPS